MSSLNSNLINGQEAHLWLVATDHLPTTADIKLLEKLSPSEQQRFQSLRIPKVQREYLITRALIRSALSCYADVAPLDWEFITNQYGRPQLAPPFAELQLNFNISHSHGAVACLIAYRHQVGLDIELNNRKNDFFDYADQVLSPHEQAALKASPGSIDFLRYWTLKEAYSKAVGLGLSLNFKNVVCAFDGVANLLDADEFTQLSRKDWQFIQLPILDNHLLAIAIGKAAHDDIAVRLMNFEPEFEHAIPGRLIGNTALEMPNEWDLMLYVKG